MDQRLLRDVYECDVCPSGWFTKDERTGKNHRFPPTIGTTGKAHVLFVGINPAMRTGDALSARKNRGLHRRSIRSLETFEMLARNRKPDNQGRDDGPYIAWQGDEPFYDIHLRVLSAARLTLEDHAAITEMFLCASANSRQFYGEIPTSRCAALYLDRTISSCDPEVIVPLGPKVDQHFRPADADKLIYQVPRAGRCRWVMPIPHPSHRGLNDGVRNTAAKRTGRWIRAILAGSQPDGVPELAVDLETVWREMAGQKRKPATHRTAQPARQPPPAAHARTQRPAPVPISRETNSAAREPTGHVPSRAVIGKWWAFVLDRNVKPTAQIAFLGPLLESHPDAGSLTEKLLQDLTLRRFIRIANMQFNKVNRRKVPPGLSQSQQATWAWRKLLDEVASGTTRQDGGWVIAERVLSEGAPEALVYIETLPIRHVISACENLIRHPYQEALRIKKLDQG